MDDKHPKVDNAPGLTWRPRQNGWEARWRARTDLVKRGYTPKVVRLWAGPWPSEIECDWISDRCNALQAEMLVWGRGGTKIVTARYDGTLRTLIACYRSDKDSPYHSKRFKTRENYDYLMGRIERDTWTSEDGVRVIGEELVRDIKARTLKRWHETWMVGGKVAMAHSLIGMLRSLATFGATILEDPECSRIKGLMHDMRFKNARPRGERITAEQATAVRVAARKMLLPSLALAQAIQFELMLRQKDVIGEWVPISEPGTSAVVDGYMKWLWGITWNEIDADLILRHTTSKRQKDIEVDLKLAPMVMEELIALYPGLIETITFGAEQTIVVHRELLPASGPVIVYEDNGKPYVTHQFRRVWRMAAKAAGVPDNVFNMDSRAGGISEATDAGADLEHIRHAATHGDIAMTQRYSRGSVEKVAGVMQRRVEHRNKKEGG